MFSRPQLKLRARQQLSGNYPAAALITVLYCAVFLALELPGTLSGQETVPFTVTLLNWLVTGPLLLALSCCFLNLAKSGGPLAVNDFFQGLCQFAAGLLGYLWMMLWIVLWTLLLIIPGIVKSLAYSQLFFILAENPALGPRKALRLSIILTDGYKWELLLTILSFIGWGLLMGVITITAAIFGTAMGVLGFLLSAMFVLPYFYHTMANIYLHLRDEAIAQGKVQRADFGLAEPVPPAADSAETPFAAPAADQAPETPAEDTAAAVSSQPQPAISLAKTPAAQPAEAPAEDKEETPDDHPIQ